MKTKQCYDHDRDSCDHDETGANTVLVCDDDQILRFGQGFNLDNEVDLHRAFLCCVGRRMTNNEAYFQEKIAVKLPTTCACSLAVCP
jgi:hypothetical protein